MLIKYRLFRIMCLTHVSIFILIAFFPLMTLAFYRDTFIEPELAAVSTSFKGNDDSQPYVYPLEAETSPTVASGLPDYDNYTVHERQEAGLRTDLPPVTPYYSEKTVYLTFDDGPDSANTSAVLSILREQGVKATFFVIGAEVEKYPDILREIYKSGHAIGNHSYSHIYRDLYSSATDYTNQLQRTDEAIKQIIGVRPRISRAPGGSVGHFRKGYWEALKMQGYKEIGWNIVAGDASSLKENQLISNVDKQLISHKYLWDHVIVLMHDGRGHEETVKALPGIIRIFKERGFAFRVINLETPSPW